MSTTAKKHPRATPGKNFCQAVDPGKGQVPSAKIIRRRRFGLVGQAKGSNDCGFFCGMVFSIARQCSSFDGMLMAEEDVYGARDRYLKPPNPTGGPGKQWLPPPNAEWYLASMGLRGKLEPQRNWSTRESTLANLEELLGSSTCHGLMIVIGFHWIAIVNPFWIGGRKERERCLYNSAPKAVPHEERLSLEELATRLHLAGPRSVVRVGRTI